jgi:hypothetical protein
MTEDSMNIKPALRQTRNYCLIILFICITILLVSCDISFNKTMTSQNALNVTNDATSTPLSATDEPQENSRTSPTTPYILTETPTSIMPTTPSLPTNNATPTIITSIPTQVSTQTTTPSVSIIPSVTTMPNVKIRSLTLPSKVSVSSGISYQAIIRLVNTESVDITVNWKAISTTGKDFDNGSVTVPKNNYIDVTKEYRYTDLGDLEMTYTIYYNGTQIDSRSDVITVIP